ncbi:MAG TPA: M20 family metallopeptidase [Kofleriaceae bacterium]|nr:M20 family metallopeptidase [Kofleriaceae bacterium]
MSEILNRALDALHRRADEIVPRLRRWVERNSYSQDVDGVNAMGALLLEDFALAGLAASRRPGKDTGDHLAWRTPAWDGASPDQRVLLVGHHDTVFPPGTFEAFEVRGDHLHGPGVLDMKGGLAVVWAALAALADTGALETLPVAMISVADEEIGSPDSRPFLEELAAGCRWALVFEGGRTGDEIITRRKGTGALEVTARGVAAHAGNCHAEGKNAIRALARFIDEVENLTDYDRGVTVNVGLVRGGEARNTVPAEASCGIDLRFITADSGRDVCAAADRLARKIAAETGCALHITGGIRRLPLSRSAASAALCERYGACARAAGLGASEAGLIGGGSDANTVSAIGVAAIDGLGPRGSGFHTHKEHIETATLMMRAGALARFLAGLDATS